MKNTTAILLIAVTITFGFFSCQKENEVELTTEEVMEPASFGIMHNKALSIFHQKFSSEKERNSLSLQDRITLFDQYLAEVVNEIEVGMLSQFVNNPGITLFFT